MKRQETFREYLERPVDVVRLIEKLDFEEEDAEGAAREQPSLLLEVARFRVQKMRRRIQSEMAFDTAKARARLKLRAKKSAGAKLTETAISDKVLLRSSVRLALKKSNRAKWEEEFTKLLLEAYRQRKDAIRIIIDARWAETGSAVRKAKLEEGKALKNKLVKEVRRRYKGSRLGGDDDD